MRGFLASVLVVIASFYLVLLLISQSVFTNVKNPDFYVELSRVSNLSSQITNYVGQFLISSFGNTLDSAKVLSFSKEIIPQALLESKIKILAEEIAGWFNSKRPVEDLSLSVGLVEVKENISSSIGILLGTSKFPIDKIVSNQIPNELKIKDLVDQKYEFYSKLIEFRTYYQLALGMRVLLWGFFALLLVFIVLLRVPFLKSALKYLGSVGIISGILSTFVGFVLPVVLPKFLNEIPFDISRILSGLVYDIGLVGIGLFLFGFVLVFFGRK